MDVMLIVRTFCLISDLSRSQDGSSTSGSLGQEGTVLCVPMPFPWVDTILHLHYRLFTFLWLSCAAQPLKNTLSVDVLVSYLKYIHQLPDLVVPTPPWSFFTSLLRWSQHLGCIPYPSSADTYLLCFKTGDPQQGFQEDQRHVMHLAWRSFLIPAHPHVISLLLAQEMISPQFL